MIIKAISLAEVEGTDGAEDSFKKTNCLINIDNVEQMHQGELKKGVPIIGQENVTDVTFIMFRSGRNIAVMETVDELLARANPK